MKFTNHHVSDLVVRIKNAAQREHSSVSVPNVKVVKSILNVLKEEGYVSSYQEDGYAINVSLKYDNRSKSIISDFVVVSKPSKRIYSNLEDVPSYYNGLGVTIISTSKGVMSDSQARQAGVGGEILCQIF